MERIGLDSVVTRGAGHVETRMGDQTVMMSIAEGKYFALQRSGQRVWELIEQPSRVGEVVERLTAEFDVAPERCAAEVLAFLEDLRRHGLVAEAPG